MATSPQGGGGPTTPPGQTVRAVASSSSPHDNGDGDAANTTVTILGRKIVLRGGTDDANIYITVVTDHDGKSDDDEPNTMYS